MKHCACAPAAPSGIYRYIMRAAQTIWRLSTVGCWLALASACDFGSKRPLPQDPRQRSPHLELPSAKPPSRSPDGGKESPAASAIAEALRSVHEQRLPIMAPRAQPARLALGAGRLLQAAVNKVVVRDAKSGEVIVEAPLDAVSALGQGSDGSLFALALSGGVRFLPRQNTAKPFPHVTFFPGSELFPDLQDPTHFFVHLPNDAQLYRYSFEAEGGAVLPIDAEFDIPGCTSSVNLLRDGAFVCSTGSSIVRKAPHGLKTEFKLPLGVAEPLRLLPAKRLDEVYAVSRSGEVAHLRLAAGTPLLARFQLPAPPFAALGNGQVLAFVLVTPPEPSEPRHWKLLITDLDGEPRFQTELPERSAAADENWLEGVVSDKNLAISWTGPEVAVGGAERVQLWDYTQGRELFAR
ncbi:MAG: hypothetical protein ABJB12_09145 [Pseudomonadota bacterium]